MFGFKVTIAAVTGAWLIFSPAASAQSVDQLLFRVLGSETAVEQSCNFRVRAELSGAVDRQSYRVRLPNYQLTVVTIPLTSVTNAIVDQTFDEAAAVLKRDQGGTDVNCCVDIRRSGNLGTFQPPASMAGFGVISNQAELDAVFGVNADVKIVNQITWCGGPPSVVTGGFSGCTDGSTQIVSVSLGATFGEPVAIAHELGHQAGLCHVAQNCATACGAAGLCAAVGCADPLSNNVMYWRVCAGGAPNQGVISGAECSSLQASAGQ